MPDDEPIDEVVLNTLLAEGVDLPTAWEASRRDSPDTPPAAGGSLVLYVVTLLAMLLAVWLVLS